MKNKHIDCGVLDHPKYCECRKAGRAIAHAYQEQHRKVSKTAEHTPGPWFVNGLEIATAKDNYFVASVEGEVKTKHDEANARLIAAAPELLDLCLRAEALLESEKLYGVLLDDLRKTIAKAVGRA